MSSTARRRRAAGRRRGRRPHRPGGRRHLLDRGLEPLVLEAGPRPAPGAGVGARAAVLPVVRARRPGAAEAAAPPAGGGRNRTRTRPGAEWAAALPAAPRRRAGGACPLRGRVVGVARQGRDLVVDAGRDAEPFTVHVRTPAGGEERITAARSSTPGTWREPNPLGADGYRPWVSGRDVDRIAYGIPDLTTRRSAPGTPASASRSPGVGTRR